MFPNEMCRFYPPEEQRIQKVPISTRQKKEEGKKGIGKEEAVHFFKRLTTTLTMNRDNPTNRRIAYCMV